MAERTGIPEIDVMIEKVIEMGYIELRFTGVKAYLSDLRRRQYAMGKCVNASGGFNTLCQNAHLPSTPIHNAAIDLGFTETFAGHTVTQFIVIRGTICSIRSFKDVMDADLYYVDWTASQFGVKELPRCCKFVKGKWVTRWEDEGLTNLH